MSDKKLWEQYVALEKERDTLRSLVVMRFDHDHPPQFTQGYDTHELTEPVTAEHCRWFVAEIERLSAEVAHIKEVEFPRKAQAVADGWRGKCERLEAKIEAMERQEPAGKFIQHPSNGLWEQDGYGDNPDARPLYALPVTQPAPSVPDATWLPVPDKHPTFDPVDLQLADGSVLCGCVPQSDGDYWWEGPSGEVFIDPRYAPVTHWRLSAEPEARQ